MKPLNILIFSASRLTTLLTIVERIQEYTEADDLESPLVKEKDKLIKKNWPKNGKIEIKNLKIRYRDNLPFVLSNITFDIEAGEKVGIVGRTGSGKSTTLLALMRILEMEKTGDSNENYIKIDDVDISKLGLHKLRKNLTIVPQDPYILEGTLRSNIDPLNEYEETEIYNVLDQVDFFKTLSREQFIEDRPIKGRRNMIDYEEDSEMGYELKELKLSDNEEYQKNDILEFKIESKGTNLSLGQRQLVCIARSLIKKPKILLMDEATASIDLRTDEIIQNVISNKISGTTVITIAHRLNTIIQYDKIVVLENGELAEIGKPKELLEKTGGKFERMVSEGGVEFRMKMIEMAK